MSRNNVTFLQKSTLQEAKDVCPELATVWRSGSASGTVTTPGCVPPLPSADAAPSPCHCARPASPEPCWSQSPPRSALLGVCTLATDYASAASRRLPALRPRVSHLHRARATTASVAAGPTLAAATTGPALAIAVAVATAIGPALAVATSPPPEPPNGKGERG
ncbi:hypothetical protein GUJ93_ZPchr0010g8477 [Zizania palustris]|uniref:Uncharacterized protein n=1 Tax=Zizania palustris TaxID=103762 RepID=A0A8J5WEW0_ZIZPA|nr:hypothetical protein GUJ93_ZPchr0010g8477 [Zizania palustris]